MFKLQWSFGSCLLSHKEQILTDLLSFPKMETEYLHGIFSSFVCEIAVAPQATTSANSDK